MTHLKISRAIRLFVTLLMIIAARSSFAEESGILALLPDAAVSSHSVSLAGRTLNYTAEAGTLPLRDGKGAITAKVFYVAYWLTNTEEQRPITFVFNGGPGAASSYLHLGALGPMILTLSDRGEILPQPSRLLPNDDTWLDLTDLVFVDPVGTGYSRAANPDDESKFWGVEQDAAAMGAFIRLYLQHTERMASPVYLVGESYGGFRAALLCRTLQEDVGITPSGAVLISPALEFSLLLGEDFDPLTWALPLPSMAAVKLEEDGVHGRAALAARLADAERFALSDYLTGLAQGLEPSGRALSAQVAHLTGLAVDVVERHHARIPISLFVKEFARATGRTLSRYDGTITAPDIHPEDEGRVDIDPVLDRSVPAWTSAFIQYARVELRFLTDISYRQLNAEANSHWDYGSSGHRQGFAGALDDLQKARALNPALRVVIAEGYTDLTTPYLTGKYLVRQLPELPGAIPIRLETYEGGHMMYLRPEARRELKEDVRSIYSTQIRQH